MNRLGQPLLSFYSKRCLSLQISLPLRHFTSACRRGAKDHVRVVEVGPRDGLQNEKKAIPVETKIELIRRLAKTGLQTIEAGSFVSPKWVPQMANSAQILESLLTDPPPSPDPITFQWLLPNAKGLEIFITTYSQHAQISPSNSTSPTDCDSAPALNTSSQNPNDMPSSSATGAMSKPRRDQTAQTPDPFESAPALNTSSQNPNDMPSTSAVSAMSTPRNPTTKPNHEISIFLAATDAFSLKNTNRTVSDSLAHSAPLIATATSHNLPVRAYISVALGCPFSGPDVDPARVAGLTAALLDMGAYEVSVADTTGMGTVRSTDALMRALGSAGVPPSGGRIALHLHDTYGQAVTNARVGLEHGVRVFDAAVAGLGGCPFSPGATGNVATEDLVRGFEGMGMVVEGGVDLEGLARVGGWVSGELGRGSESRAGRAVLARL